MKTKKLRDYQKTAISLTLLALPLALGAQGAPAPSKPWSYSASLTLRESFDSNVYLQDTAPAPANVAAAQAAGLNPVPARKESLVTTIIPRVDLSYKPCAAFRAAVGYAPEVTFYHSAHSEDHVAHRGTLNLGGTVDKANWDLLNTFGYIDGSKLGPVFARPGDVPAVGGIPLRDRRESFLYRSGFKLTVTADKFFVRPVASVYLHNFLTRHIANPTPAVYQYVNSIDRRDISGGVDLGYQVADKTHLVAGYRYGAQEQRRLLGVDSPYDSAYHRLLAGVEGSPAKWLKLAVMGGPEIRDFERGTPAGFDRGETIYYMDASVTLLPTAKDSITLLNRRYEQPAFTSTSMYEDITYDIAWKHKFNDAWAAGAGFRLYIGDWQAPVNREDWIYTPSASVTYTHKKFNVEAAYSYDWVDSQLPNTAGREFTRHIVSLSAKYNF